MKLFAKTSSLKRQKEYEKLMKRSMEAQRSGDIVAAADLHARAEALRKELKT